MGHSKSIVWLTTQLHELTKHVRNNTEDCERQDQLLDTLHQRLDEVDARLELLEATTSDPDTATRQPFTFDSLGLTVKSTLNTNGVEVDAGGVPTKEAEIANRFAYHKPPDSYTVELHEQTRDACHTLADFIHGNIPPGRQQAMALTAVEEAMHWANAAIACNPKAGV